MITPVENGRTSSGVQSSCFATAAQVRRAASIPASPVPALALPALISSARVCRAGDRCSRQTMTGAAQKRFWVKTPDA
jgi:hypothetical protein